MKRLSIVAVGVIAAVAGTAALWANQADRSAEPTAVPAAANLQTAVFRVGQMTCATCPITVKVAMSAVNGVASVDVDFDAKTATVRFDPAIAAPGQIAEASTNAGYPAAPVSSIDGAILEPARLVITTGASPWAPPIEGLAEAGYLTSTEALALTTLPRSLVVIGGSAVGLEIAQFYARLGTRVSVLEAMPALVPAEDGQVGSALAGYLREEGLDVRTGVSIQRVTRDQAGYTLRVTTADGVDETLAAEHLLVATGRRANARGFGLEDAGIEVGKRGELRVNQCLQTSRPEVYAAGDVIGDPMFVYVAAYGGHLAAENAIRGNTRQYDLSALPRVTFTDPQVAAVGMTEEDARRSGVDVMVATLPLSYVPRALAARETRGFIKLVADRRTNRLVGAHILATDAGEMIQEPTLAIRHGLTIDDLATAFHPYLTLAEGIKLAAQTFTKDVKKLSCCAA